MIVRHSRGEYPVEILPRADVLRELTGAIVVTDANVAPYLAGLDPLVVPPGEGSKDLATFGDLLDRIARRGATRRTPLAAVGGGVVGDLAGFVAAAYMRGVPFVQVPTTLLAMVDSSVGGKVAVDLPSGKNLAGAFWPPARVLLSPEWLESLPEREHRNGMAEVWKTAVIRDADLFARLERRAPGTLDMATIERCVRHKADVVEADEFETNGLRATLNFGHTIAHAVEAVLGYGVWAHGEAVAAGMVAEARLAERLGHAPRGTADRIEAALVREGLPTALPPLPADDLLDAMRRDKKAGPGRLAFALPLGIGECRLFPDVPEDDVRAVIG